LGEDAASLLVFALHVVFDFGEAGLGWIEVILQDLRFLESLPCVAALGVGAYTFLEGGEIDQFLKGDTFPSFFELFITCGW
jgi:hypothetical protein